jgi:hypothetical protein
MADKSVYGEHTLSGFTDNIEDLTKRGVDGSFSSVDITLNTLEQQNQKEIFALAKILGERDVESLTVRRAGFVDATFAFICKVLGKHTHTLCVDFGHSYVRNSTLTDVGMPYFKKIFEHKLLRSLKIRGSSRILDGRHFAGLISPDSTIETLDLSYSAFELSDLMECLKANPSSPLKNLILTFYSSSDRFSDRMTQLTELVHHSNVVSLDLGVMWRTPEICGDLANIYANPKLIKLAFGVSFSGEDLDPEFIEEFKQSLGKAVSENTTLKTLVLRGYHPILLGECVFGNLGKDSKLETVCLNFGGCDAPLLPGFIFDAIVRGCPLTTLDWGYLTSYPRLEAALNWNRALDAWRREVALLMFCWKHSSDAAPGGFALKDMPPELLFSEVLKKPQLESYLGEVPSSKRKATTEGEDAPFAKVQRT